MVLPGNACCNSNGPGHCSESQRKKGRERERASALEKYKIKFDDKTNKSSISLTLLINFSNVQ
jgi:hypothetical protein